MTEVIKINTYLRIFIIEHQGTYTASKKVCIGKVEICEVFYDGTRSKDDPKKYRCTGLITGIKKDLGVFETEEQALMQGKRAAEVFIKQLSA